MSSPSFSDCLQRAKSLRIESRAFIDGQFIDAEGGGVFERFSPIDGKPLASVARCRAPDIDKAVSAARRVYESGIWRNLEPAARKEKLLNWARLIREHGQELALLESVEVGKPYDNTVNVDIPGCANAIAYYAEYADKLYEEVAPTGPHDQAIIKRMPLGVIGVIVPWNYPLIIAGWKLGPALVLGNSVILKPAEQSSLASIYLGMLANLAGIPHGVFNVIPGLGTEAGEALIRHMDVDMIAFTGSTRTGRRIMAAAAETNLKRVALELGGKSPQIVLEDCPDLNAAASAIAWSIYYNAGQTCHAGSRLIVQKSVAAPLYQKIIEVAQSLKIGHPLDPQTQFGALVEQAHMNRVMSFLDMARAENAEFLLGGNSISPVAGGCYIEPTLLKHADLNSRLIREEIFGPVLVAIEVNSAEEAVKIANDTDYGLAAAIWTSDMNKAHHISNQLRAGTVWVNSYDLSSMATPFGGFKQSGFGRDRSIHALDKYCDYKTIWTHFN